MPLGIVSPPSIAVPYMPLSRTVRKIDDERMSLNLIGGMAGCGKRFSMRDEAAIRNREVCGPRAGRRWFGKVTNGQDHGSEISNPLASATGGDQDRNRLKLCRPLSAVVAL